MKNTTPMMRQYHDMKRQNPDTLLFFRLGDFYEMFYDDAVLASRELDITLTSRNTDSGGSPIPMCGVPHHSVQTYLGRLINRGHRVALCEQVANAQPGKGIVRREVTRIVTPGTVIEEGALDSKKNNFISSLLVRHDCVGVSFLDLSTGEFCLTEFSGEQAWDQAREELMRFHPRELIMAESSQSSLSEQLPHGLKLNTVQTPQPDWTFDKDYSHRVLLEHFGVATLEGFGLNGQQAAIAAAGGLLAYIRSTQKSPLNHITQLMVLEPTNYLKLDESTLRNLEIVAGLDGNKRGTLLATLDCTRTGMGGRLLRSWMIRPSLNQQQIEERLDAVQELHKSAVRMGQLGEVLSPIQDLERLLGRVTLETANARDLVALRESLKQLPKVNRQLEDYASKLLRPHLDLLENIIESLQDAIADDPPVGLNDGGIIRMGFSSELDELREIVHSGKTFIARLESKEREKTGISSLKVKYNKVFGYFIEITNSHLKSVPDHYQRKQTLVGSERFITPELKDYEEKVLTAEDRIFELEKELFVKVRREVGEEASRIQQVAHIIARLDVLLSLAEVAQKYRYVRPCLDDSRQLEIRGGRHPVVELQSNDPFVANDLHCNASRDQLLILTGPNMGGKSTYLRQNALIVILAQMGSFVPADAAHIGLVDRIFTRVGASDNLAQGRSTFMVEMIETANILNTATTRSFVLLDEVGRGTATFDGLSIAWSIAEYLIKEPSHKARTLFATHYQELTKLEALYEGVKNYRVNLRESGGKIIFLHRVSEGAASRSYGIEVARLAGLPAPVVQRARQILSRLERKELNLFGRSQAVSQEVIDELQKTLF